VILQRSNESLKRERGRMDSDGVFIPSLSAQNEELERQLKRQKLVEEHLRMELDKRNQMLDKFVVPQLQRCHDMELKEQREELEARFDKLLTDEKVRAGAESRSRVEELQARFARDYDEFHARSVRDLEELQANAARELHLQGLRFEEARTRCAPRSRPRAIFVFRVWHGMRGAHSQRVGGAARATCNRWIEEKKAIFKKVEVERADAGRAMPDLLKETCAICMSELLSTEVNTTVHITKTGWCSHYFHKSCVDTFMETRLKRIRDFIEGRASETKLAYTDPHFHCPSCRTTDTRMCMDHVGGKTIVKSFRTLMIKLIDDGQAVRNPPPWLARGISELRSFVATRRRGTRPSVTAPLQFVLPEGLDYFSCGTCKTPYMEEHACCGGENENEDVARLCHRCRPDVDTGLPQWFVPYVAYCDNCDTAMSRCVRARLRPPPFPFPFPFPFPCPFPSQCCVGVQRVTHTVTHTRRQEGCSHVTCTTCRYEHCAICFGKFDNWLTTISSTNDVATMPFCFAPDANIGLNRNKKPFLFGLCGCRMRVHLEQEARAKLPSGSVLPSACLMTEGVIPGFGRTKAVWRHEKDSHPEEGFAQGGVRGLPNIETTH